VSKRPIILVTSGTAGDVLPFLALGTEFVRRGYPVVLMTSPDHERLVPDGIEFVAIGEPDWPQEGRDEWLFWRDAIVPAYAVLAREILSRFERAPLPIIVAREGNWAVRFCSEKLAVPFARIVLQPCALVEQRNPVPPFVVTVLNQVRASIGLPAGERFFDNDDHWQPTISLFPAWYGQPQSSYEQAGLTAGFPFHDRADATIPPEVSKFLAKHAPVVVFSAGTGLSQTENFLSVAADFCRLSALPTIFLGPCAQPGPVADPGHFVAARYSDHSLLFPRCRLVVHNGGIGTTAQCMRAGVPQVVVPLRYDQPDNAERVRALGLGAVLDPDGLSAPAILSAYRLLASDAGLSRRLRERATLIASRNTAATAADWVEEALRGGLFEPGGGASPHSTATPSLREAGIR